VPAKKLVGGRERVASAIFTTDGRSIIFRRDTGNDENYHILRVGADGTGVTDLTPEGGVWRDSPLLPKGKADTMVYAVRKTTDIASMLLVQSISPSPPRIVFRDPLPGTAIDVTSDGTRVLWVHEALTGGNELLEIEMMTGESRLIASANVTTAAYATDGARIFVGTDNGTNPTCSWLSTQSRARCSQNTAKPRRQRLRSIRSYPRRAVTVWPLPSTQATVPWCASSTRRRSLSSMTSPYH